MRYCTPIQARKLYDLGIRDDNAPSWYNSHDGSGGNLDVEKYWISSNAQKHYGAIPALSADVLALLIPYVYTPNRCSPDSDTPDKWWMVKDYKTTKECPECGQYQDMPMLITLSDSIAEVMAILVIFLLETGEVKLHWCNEQLNLLSK